jgi:hypothetical protein
MEKNADKIRDLWTRMTAETDPDKLPELNNELGVVLDEYERNLATSPQHETLYVDRANAVEWARVDHGEAMGSLRESWHTFGSLACGVQVNGYRH